MDANAAVLLFVELMWTHMFDVQGTPKNVFA
jgi:hypothetical protein